MGHGSSLPRHVLTLKSKAQMSNPNLNRLAMVCMSIRLHIYVVILCLQPYDVATLQSAEATPLCVLSWANVNDSISEYIHRVHDAVENKVCISATRPTLSAPRNLSMRWSTDQHQAPLRYLLHYLLTYLRVSCGQSRDRQRCRLLVN